MRSEVLAFLRCPVCVGPLADTGTPAGPPDNTEGLSAASGWTPAPPGGAGRTPGCLRCPRGHSFDIARQGYVHLAGRTPHSGDTADMVASRMDFLAAGHYAFISTALAEAASAGTGADAGTGEGADAGGPLVVDAGAGTGRHLAAVLDALPGAVGLALDASKPALRRAARAHPRAGAVLCDTWRRLPLADSSASVLLNVFAPRNGAEFRRVLRPDGLLLVVVPAVDHLTELITLLGLLRVDPEKPARVAAGLGAGFDLVGQSAHRRTLHLSRTHVRALVGMGPSAWHADPATLDRGIAALGPATEVTASILLCRYRPLTGNP